MVRAVVAILLTFNVALTSKVKLFGENGATLPGLHWNGGVELLSEEPPIFIIRSLLGEKEADQIIDDYGMDFFADFEVHSKDSLSQFFQQCLAKFPVDRCASGVFGGSDDFPTDSSHFISHTMIELRSRIANVTGTSYDHMEDFWLMNLDRQRRAQNLHLDNHHHFMYPKRVASVLIYLREGVSGIAFPLASMRNKVHKVAEESVLVDSLNMEANAMPFRGSSSGRHFKDGVLDDALRVVCSDAPIHVGKGDALIYYNLKEDGVVDVRALQALCNTESARTAKLFMATWIRGQSLLSIYRNFRTPTFEDELRAWIDSRRGAGFDSSVVVTDSNGQLATLSAASCLGPAPAWFVQLGRDVPSILCHSPQELNYTFRDAGEPFQVQFRIGNTGENSWPDGTTLTLREGQAMGSPAGIRLPQVDVGEVVDLSIQFIAPDAGAKAFGIWSLTDTDRQPFGSLLWIDARSASSALTLPSEDLNNNASGAVNACDALAADSQDQNGDNDSAEVVEDFVDSGCAVFWKSEVFKELSSQCVAFPSYGNAHRGSPRLCWALGHRFWFASFAIHEDPLRSFIFGFCTPHACEDAEHVRNFVVVPWVASVFPSRSSILTEGKQELQEWTAPWPFSSWMLGLLVPAMLATALDVVGLQGKMPRFLRGFSIIVGFEMLTTPRQASPARLRFVGTCALLAFHFNEFSSSFYQVPGLPPALRNFGYHGVGVLHDPVFHTLSTQLLLSNGPMAWTPYRMVFKLLRKWTRLAPVGLASRLITCNFLQKAPIISFILNVQPRLDGQICGPKRCTMSCSSLYSGHDIFLAFAPLDHAGWFIEQDVATSCLVAALAVCIWVGSWLRLFACVLIGAWALALLCSLPHCVGSDGRTDGQCWILPFTSTIYLPDGSLYPLLGLVLACIPSAGSSGSNGARWPFAGVLLAMAMEMSGFLDALPSHHWMFLSAWWLVCKCVLAVSLASLVKWHYASDITNRSPMWLAAFDRLSFGICVVHVRVLEFLFGYSRPILQEFSWSTCIFDYLALLVCASTASLAIFLFVQAPCEVVVAWLLREPCPTKRGA